MHGHLTQQTGSQDDLNLDFGRHYGYSHYQKLKVDKLNNLTKWD